MLKKWLVLSFLGLLTHSVSANGEKSICGIDNRVPSQDPHVARALGTISDIGGCTLTMISRSCAISAGHCVSTFGLAQFNTPPSINGRIQHPANEDIYEIDKSSIESVNGGIGNDWAVMKIKPHKTTGLYAGDAQGFYEVSFEAPAVDDMVRITGYGLDRSDPKRNLAQQTHTGAIKGLNGSTMEHIADTMGGNSGSSILLEKTGKIVAIHTHGGCSRFGGSNSSTLINKSEKLKIAIRACLDSDRD